MFSVTLDINIYELHSIEKKTENAKTQQRINVYLDKFAFQRTTCTDAEYWNE